MKKYAIMFIPIFVILFLSVSLLGYERKVNSKIKDEFTIIIDAGHGGMDSGTSAADGTREKDINLAVAKKLNVLLSVCGYKTVMLRTDDELIGDNSLETVRARKVSDIKKRLSIAESYENAVLISVHQNYYSVEKYNGAQVFYSPNSPLSRDFAAAVQNSIVSLIQPQNYRKIKAVDSNIYLLYNCSVPAIMVECGFLSNSNETRLLKQDDYQTKIAMAIMNGIINCLE